MHMTCAWEGYEQKEWRQAWAYLMQQVTHFFHLCFHQRNLFRIFTWLLSHTATILFMFAWAFGEMFPIQFVKWCMLQAKKIDKISGMHKTQLIHKQRVAIVIDHKHKPKNKEVTISYSLQDKKKLVV